MKTAIDSSILITLKHRQIGWESWLETLSKAQNQGSLHICPVVLAEVAPSYANLRDLHGALEALNIKVDQFSHDSCFLAGLIFAQYRRNKGPRTNMIPDFLIAAHAELQADQLATTDDGFLRTYFPDLKIISPS